MIGFGRSVRRRRECVPRGASTQVLHSDPALRQLQKPRRIPQLQDGFFQEGHGMNAGPGGSSRLSFLATGPAAEPAALCAGDERLDAAIARTTEFLLHEQNPDGYWCAELEGDSILESEYILLLAFLGRADSTIAKEAAACILEQQCDHGGWAIYPGGPIEISASVKSYLALKITGTDPRSEPMLRARKAILAAGGVERVNSFTRYYLAMLGLIPYDLCPAVPPEMI